MSVSRLLVFVCVSLLAATCVAGWTWRNPNDQIADFTILKGVPCIYQYGAGANKVFYVGQATDCADRLNQHEREQAQFAQLAWSIKLTHSTGNLLDYIALNDFGNVFGHDACIMKHAFAHGDGFSLSVFLVKDPTRLDEFEAALISFRGTYVHRVSIRDRGCNRNRGHWPAAATAAPTASQELLNDGNWLPFRASMRSRDNPAVAIFKEGETLECTWTKPHTLLQLTDNKEHTSTQHTDKETQHTQAKRPVTAERLRSVLDPRTP